MKSILCKKRFWLTVIYMVALLISIVLLFVLDKNYDYSLGQHENANKFGVSFMTMNNPFFEVIDESIRTTVEANGDIVITRDPALNSDRQITQIREMIEEEVDGIFICPVDYEKILPVIMEAKEKGIYIVLVDTAIMDESLADSVVVSDNYHAGELCAKYLMEQKPSAKILILEHTRVRSAIDRVQGFEDVIKGNDAYEIVYRDDSEGQLEIAMPHTQKIIRDGVDFDTIFAINDISALGAMGALKDSGKLSEVSVLGVDGAPEAKAMIKENMMLATAVQFPSEIGESAVSQMYKILRNESCEKKVLVKVSLVSKSNVDLFGTRSWQ